MDFVEQSITVQFRYPVYFTTGMFAPGNRALIDICARGGHEEQPRLAFVVDDGVATADPGLIDRIVNFLDQNHESMRMAATPLIVQGGEAAKNSSAPLDAILDLINDAGLCRQSYLVAIGGGALLDVAGYAAAVAHRGLRLIRVPTTVLAQDDSGVGVKNGINYFGKKNYLGTFAPPFAVINDFAFLCTLSDRDWRSGLSEAVKVALVRDPAFFDLLEEHADALRRRDLPAIELVVRRCAQLHLDHIAQSGDPFERGSTRPLDFGHWAAHRLEHLTRYKLRHGEAVAIGIALDTTYSHLAGFLDDLDRARVIGILQTLGFDLFVPELNDARLMRGLTEFREHLGGRLTISMLRGIGQSFDVHEIDEQLMRRSIDALAALTRAGEAATLCGKESI